MLSALIASAPSLLMAQYSEGKMGEYLNYAVAAASGGIYAGYSSIGSPGPTLYTPSSGWIGLPSSLGYNTSLLWGGSTTGISRDGNTISGYTYGTTLTGSNIQEAVYWVGTTEFIVPAPPDDSTPTNMSATGISADGTTLLVEDTVGSRVETYVYKIGTQKFTSVGFLGSAVQQTYARAISSNGGKVAGYSNLDDGNTDGFTWSTGSGLKDMGIPASHPNTVYLEPTCISDDGNTIYGQLTELNGWLGFRYNVNTGWQDLGDLQPSACSADGSETVGIQFMYFPGIWSVANGGGYIDNLLSAHGITQAIGTTEAPVTISPDGSQVIVTGPDAYLTDQTWYGAWYVDLPGALKTAPIAPKTLGFSTAYMTTLTEPPTTLTQYAEFSTGATAVLNTPPSHAASFVLNADGSFSYTPVKGYGDKTDSFTYRLLGPHGHSNVGTVQISVASHISRFSPADIAVGSPDTVVTVIGAGFVNGDYLLLNGSTAIATTYISSSELQMTIPAADLATAGPLRFTVDGASNVGTVYVK